MIETKIVKLNLDLILFDDDLLARELPLSLPTANEYEEIYRTDPSALPPPRVFQVGKLYYVTQGRHRVVGAKQAGLKELDVELCKGTFAEAQWDAAGGNCDQLGLRRTRKDQQVAIQRAIQAFPDRTDAMVASHVRVSPLTVTKLREKLESEGVVEEVDERIDARGRVRNRKEHRRATAPKKAELEKVPVPPDEESPPLRDASGDVVPPSAIDVFADHRLSDFLQLIQKSHRDLVHIENEFLVLRKLESRLPWVKWGELLNLLPSLIAQAAEAFHAVNQGLPFVVCPECGGDGCVDCHRSGYFPRWGFENKPEYGA